MSKIRVVTEFEMPATCGVCPYYFYVPYQCYNESGQECGCTMGYMAGLDRRGMSFKKSLYSGCRLKKEYGVVEEI